MQMLKLCVDLYIDDDCDDPQHGLTFFVDPRRDAMQGLNAGPKFD